MCAHKKTWQVAAATEVGYSSPLSAFAAKRKPPQVVSQTNRVTPKLRGLAKSLVAYEASRKKSAAAKIPPPVLLVAEKLRPHLANLMGNGGFRALLSRALVLASAKVSWLREVHVNGRGTLDGAEALHAQVSSAEFIEGEIVLLIEFFALLEALIGPALTSRLVGEIWPHI
jgi:hypothetical protein